MPRPKLRNKTIVERRRVSRKEKEEIERKLFVQRENFALLLLQGMLNTTQHIIGYVVSPKDAEWFENCIRYMMEKIRKDKARRKEGK